MCISVGAQMSVSLANIPNAQNVHAFLMQKRFLANYSLFIAFTSDLFKCKWIYESTEDENMHCISAFRVYYARLLLQCCMHMCHPNKTKTFLDFTLINCLHIFLLAEMKLCAILYFKCCVSRKKTYKNSFFECILFIATRFDFAFPEFQNRMWFIGKFFTGSTMILLNKGIWEIFGRFIAKKREKYFQKY